MTVNKTDYKIPDVYVGQDFVKAISNGDALTPPNAAEKFLRAYAKVPTKRNIYELLAIYKPGEPSMDGKSAYQIWLEYGNTGSIGDFLNSLVGQPGDAGDSAYQTWLNLGYTGNENDFIISLMGTNGKSAYELWLAAGHSGTVNDFLNSLIGTSAEHSATAAPLIAGDTAAIGTAAKHAREDHVHPRCELIVPLVAPTNPKNGNIWLV